MKKLRGETQGFSAGCMFIKCICSKEYQQGSTNKQGTNMA